MQKLLTLLASVSIVAVLAIGFSSCKDDEEPKNATLTFSTTSKTVDEGETNVKANLVLDRAAPADIIVEYELSGSATRKIGAATNGDYEIVGSVGEVEIAKGETTGAIELNILSDNSLELDEKIILTLLDVSSSQVNIGTDDEMEITIGGGGNVTAAFASTSLTVNESEEGLHEIEVQLSSAAAFDVTVEYDLTPFMNAGGDFIQGIAIDSLSAVELEPALDEYYHDYKIEDVSGKVTIPAGETTGLIKINVYSDFILELDETIELTLKNTTGVAVGTNNKFTVTIKQENGIGVQLNWPENANADMDMFIWLIGELNTAPGLDSSNIALSASPSTDGREISVIPDVFSEAVMDGLNVSSVHYGASFVYWGGTSNALNFEVDYANITDGVATDLITKGATYTLENINEWDSDTGTKPIVVQTFEYSAGGLANVSEIIPPAKRSRSRLAKAPIKEGFKKMNVPIDFIIHK